MPIRIDRIAKRHVFAQEPAHISGESIGQYLTDHSLTMPESNTTGFLIEGSKAYGKADRPSLVISYGHPSQCSRSLASIGRIGNGNAQHIRVIRGAQHAFRYRPLNPLRPYGGLSMSTHREKWSADSACYGKEFEGSLYTKASDRLSVAFRLPTTEVESHCLFPFPMDASVRSMPDRNK